MARTTNDQMTFADLEFQQQGIMLRGVLLMISSALDKAVNLVQLVHQDLVAGVKNPDRGRNGITAEQTLRSLILQRIKNWTLRELSERISDGYTLRIFSRFFINKVPGHDTFHRAFAKLSTDTVRAINDAVVKLAVHLGVEDGRYLRVDTTVVETDIHYPTDAGLLWDSVRKLTDLVRKVREIVPAAANGFANRTRRAKRRKIDIDRLAPNRKKRMINRYRDLIGVTEEVISSARQVVAQIKSATTLDPLQDALAQALAQEIEMYCGLADRVVNQTRRRVLNGESVPVQEKIFSIFEPHTDLIKRGKARTPVEFGRKTLFADTAVGIVTEYKVLRGNPSDDIHVVESLENHKKLFDRVPHVFATDRGFSTEATRQACRDAGVKIECLRKRGKPDAERAAYQKSRAFRKGQCFRAGIEGRISVLFRGRGMRRCRLSGEDRFEFFVGTAVLANNLLAIARYLLANKDTSILCK